MQYKDKISLPDGCNKLLLHSCCAPCSGELIEFLIFSEIKFSIFFYNPNIHPLKEYNIRKEENIKFAKKHNIEFIDADYDVINWFNKVKGFEKCPERGERCSICFDMRFEKTAQYAINNGFDIITSSLGISRWKDLEQINRIGLLVANKYKNLKYWTYNWRKNGGSQRMITISKRENFYKQEYCGCSYSLRDTNIHRIQHGKNKIQIGINFYKN
ncbi:hypothetical protein CKSOR_00389 [Candidatus Kinetoplastibacterium sorsogonicusi]|uniref:Epoxyqueuosine reductase QueH n=1 Tax=Candidatus Kinetoplastidibacterium kentomonadis TaxID=1576550 RepID=A0A3Q8EUD1_9PROT|nr:epoxyqueuosine reductase QueH [Candidatus Kinetoplastibacterium sorsogonicusi]AWD32506.1 hypothetical protein CKSOR_00389 [Candidatus Kinetoplastibacterium sorsogonicusi]